MKKSDKFKIPYKNQLLINIPNLTKYLESKTSYKILIDIVLDKDFGWTYSISVSIDTDFSRIAKWVIYSTGKTNIKNELLANIAHFDFKNKKLGGTKTKVSKSIKSTSLKIDCVNCGDEKPIWGNFHRNTLSIYEQREGYCPVCLSCAYSRATVIMEKNDFNFAILYLCALFDRIYYQELINEITNMNLTTEEKFGLYFRRLNLYPSLRKKGNIFSSSDIQF